MNSTQIVLPARLGSTRLKEKLMQNVAGKSVLEHTYRAAKRARCAANGILIAVDDSRLADLADSFGAKWVMTPKDCRSGTDRIAFVAEQFADTEIFVNVQADEPEIDPDAIDAVADLLRSYPEADIATAGTPIRQQTLLHDPSIVKIVMGDNALTQSGTEQGREAPIRNRAVYFSRAPLPFCRDDDWNDHLEIEPPCFWHHLGLYAYRRDFLAWFSSAPEGTLEAMERLEQLRAIEAGKEILVAPVAKAMPGIDTHEDLDAFRSRLG